MKSRIKSDFLKSIYAKSFFIFTEKEQNIYVGEKKMYLPYQGSKSAPKKRQGSILAKLKMLHRKVNEILGYSDMGCWTLFYSTLSLLSRVTL